MDNESNMLNRIFNIENGIFNVFLPILALFGGTFIVLMIVHFFGPLIPPLALVATIAVFL